MRFRLNNISSVFVIMAIIMLFSCENNCQTQKSSQSIDAKQRKESMEKANRYIVIQENEAIDDYVERHQMDVVKTGTGLRYRIVKQGDTELIKRGDVVSMEYEVRLLTGDLLYSSKEDGKKTFLVGKGGVESGLEEAVLHLHKGDVADIIIPSHLAFGLLGDGDKVPPRAALVYKIIICN